MDAYFGFVCPIGAQVKSLAQKFALNLPSPGVPSFQKNCKYKLSWVTRFQFVEAKRKKLKFYATVSFAFFLFCLSCLFKHTRNYNFNSYNIIIDSYNIYNKNVFDIFCEFDNEENLKAILVLFHSLFQFSLQKMITKWRFFVFLRIMKNSFSYISFFFFFHKFIWRQTGI